MVDEPSIVSGDDQRPIPSGQGRLESVDEVEVEVVRRLIDDENLWIGGDRQGELHPPSVALGELADRTAPVTRME